MANQSEAARRARKVYRRKRELRQQREQAERDFAELAESGFNGTVLSGIVAAWSGVQTYNNIPVLAYSHTTKLEAAGMAGGKIPTVILEIDGKLVRIRVDTPERRHVGRQTNRD